MSTPYSEHIQPLIEYRRLKSGVVNDRDKKCLNLRLQNSRCELLEARMRSCHVSDCTRCAHSIRVRVRAIALSFVPKRLRKLWTFQMTNGLNENERSIGECTAHEATNNEYMGPTSRRAGPIDYIYCLNFTSFHLFQSQSSAYVVVDIFGIGQAICISSPLRF